MKRRFGERTWSQSRRHRDMQAALDTAKKNAMEETAGTLKMRIESAMNDVNQIGLGLDAITRRIASFLGNQQRAPELLHQTLMDYASRLTVLANKATGYAKQAMELSSAAEIPEKCNRTACNNPHDGWFNTVTQRYYCQSCMVRISEHNLGIFERRGARDLDGPIHWEKDPITGKPICVDQSEEYVRKWLIVTEVEFEVPHNAQQAQDDFEECLATPLSMPNGIGAEYTIRKLEQTT